MIQDAKNKMMQEKKDWEDKQKNLGKLVTKLCWNCSYEHEYKEKQVAKCPDCQVNLLTKDELKDRYSKDEYKKMLVRREKNQK